MSDNGSCYRSKLWAATCTELGIKVKHTRPYRPQTNSKIERFHRTLAAEWAFTRHYQSELVSVDSSSAVSVSRSSSGAYRTVPVDSSVPAGAEGRSMAGGARVCRTCERTPVSSRARASPTGPDTGLTCAGSPAAPPTARTAAVEPAAGWVVSMVSLRSADSVATGRPTCTPAEGPDLAEGPAPWLVMGTAGGAVAEPKAKSVPVPRIDRNPNLVRCAASRVRVRSGA
ncbi:transposase family protein [Nocardia transvalensis]|nr:transposase family protein [Nocardia transvalensis]